MLTMDTLMLEKVQETCNGSIPRRCYRGGSCVTAIPLFTFHMQLDFMYISVITMTTSIIIALGVLLTILSSLCFSEGLIIGSVPSSSLQILRIIDGCNTFPSLSPVHACNNHEGIYNGVLFLHLMDSGIRHVNAFPNSLFYPGNHIHVLVYCLHAILNWQLFGWHFII